MRPTAARCAGAAIGCGNGIPPPPGAAGRDIIEANTSPIVLPEAGAPLPCGLAPPSSSAPPSNSPALGLLISVNAVFGRRDGGKADCRSDSTKAIQVEKKEQKAGVQTETESVVKPAPPVSIVPIMKNKTFKVLNADNVSHFTPPFRHTALAGTASSKVLEVLDNAGKPPEGKEPSMEYGGAVFQVDVPTAGAYKIYLRVWWEGSCGNTMNIMVGDEKKSITVGNDSKYEQWHWVEVPRQYQLAQGPTSIAILNREDDIKLDQILITSDLAYVPQGIEK